MALVKILVFLLLLTSLPLFASEADDIKASLKRDFPQLKEIDIHTVQKNDTGDLLLVFLEKDVYVAERGKSDWKFIDHFSAEGVDDIEFKPGKKIALKLTEGGSDHSETHSVWRLEGDAMKIIGQDSTAYSGWNQGVVKTSVNYLSGRMTVTSSSSGSKSKTRTCKFNPKKFRNQKLSEIGVEGAKEPNCGSSG